MDRAGLRSVAHELLRQEFGAVSVGRLCPRCGSSEHGQPLLRVRSGPAPRISLSYATDLVAVACSAGPVGIDVEDDGPRVGGFDRLAWTEAEAAFKADAEVPLATLELPDGYVGTVAGDDVSWRLAGPAAPPGPATR
jgi:phosphopantetheinyl transferase